jgi:hypothetical protein
MNPAEEKYLAARQAHLDWCRRLAVADGQRASAQLLAKLQHEVDEAWKERCRCFKIYMES